MKQFLIAFCVLCAVLVCAPAVAPVVLAEESAPAAYAEEAAPEQEPDLSAEPQTFEEEPAAAEDEPSAGTAGYGFDVPDLPDGEEKTYAGQGAVWQEDRVITFDQLVSDVSYQSSGRIPSYIDQQNRLTACGPVAGGNVVGFYDIVYADLIPDFASGFNNNGLYVFFPMRGSTQVQEVIDELYTKMKTDQGQSGTTKNNCLNGLEEYFDDHGLDFTTEGLMSGSNPNYSKLRAHVQSKNVALAFLSGYQFITTLNIGDDQITFEANVTNATHIVALYGYREIVLIEDGVQKTEYFLMVASGITDYITCYIRVNDHLQIDDLLGVEVSERA